MSVSATAGARAGAGRSPAGAHALDAEAASDHLERLYRAAVAICGSPQLAEDLVQETYVKVLSRPRALRHKDELGYLIRALSNTWRSHLRARAVRPRPAELAAPDEVPAAGRVGDPELASEASTILNAITALPDGFRDVVAAVDLAGLSYAECARALRISEGTVMSRLARARARIAAGLDAREG